MEQTELGSGPRGVVAVSVQCQWSWELGWHVRISYRRSGSDLWEQNNTYGIREMELPASVNDRLCEVLGLF